MTEGSLTGRACLVAGDDTPLRAALCAGLERAGATVASAPTAPTRAAADGHVAECRGRLGNPPEVLVTVPARLEAAGIDELDRAAFDGAMTAAYKSPFLYTQALLGDLRAGGRGRVVYVTSPAGLLGRAFTAHVAAGARAAIALMRTVAYEEAPAVTANAIAAGPLDGDPLLAARARGLAEQGAVEPEAAVGAVAERMPLGRLVSAGDVLETLLWLLRPESGFVTGQVVTVAGASELQVWP